MPSAVPRPVFLVADRVANRMVGVVLRSPLRLTTERALFHHAHEGLYDFLHRRGGRTVFLGSEDELDPAELHRTLLRHLLLLGLIVMGAVRSSRRRAHPRVPTTATVRARAIHPVIN